MGHLRRTLGYCYVAKVLTVNTEVYFLELFLRASVSGSCWLSTKAWVTGKTVPEEGFKIGGLL